MQIGEQIVDLLVGQYIAEAVHLVSADADDVAHPRVVGWHAAHAEIRLLENALQTWSSSSARGVCRMATVAVLVVDVASSGLLRV